METLIKQPEVGDVVDPRPAGVEQSEELAQLRQEIEGDVPSLGWEWG